MGICRTVSVAMQPFKCSAFLCGIQTRIAGKWHQLPATEMQPAFLGGPNVSSLVQRAKKKTLFQGPCSDYDSVGTRVVCSR